MQTTAPQSAAPAVPLPAAFVRQVHALLGDAEATALCAALDGTPPVSLRLNAQKAAAALPAAADGIVPWCADSGRYLVCRPRFTGDPLLHAGAYYVQEAASMAIALAAKALPEAPRRVLDLCAAPGGKSTLWRAVLPDDCLLVANEPIGQRAQILRENLEKWGHSAIVVTQAWPEAFAPLAGLFDVVAADVPCSGEGMFRKDHDARSEWSADSPALCAERQRAIIADIWSALRTGGCLVYSTCTFNSLENEDNVDWICRTLGAEVLPIAADDAWGITGDVSGRGLPVCRFLPHRTRGEGFFMALLRKTAETPATRRGKSRGKDRGRSGSAAVQGAKSVAPWLDNASAYRILRTDDVHLAAIPESMADDAQRIAQNVRTLAVGTELAEEKGRKMVPAHALALAAALRADAFPRVALGRDDALAYLRREALTLPEGTPRGYVVVAYEGLPLGFVNNLGARANNLYPAAWRIRCV